MRRSSMLVTSSGSPMPRMVLVHLKICAKSERGMPIISQMISNGNGAAISLTKSHSPLGNFASRLSTNSVALFVTKSSTRLISFGANPFETMERKRKCLGSSIAMMEPKNSLSSTVRSAMFEPLPLQKSSGWRLTCQISSWRVRAI